MSLNPPMSGAEKKFMSFTMSSVFGSVGTGAVVKSLGGLTTQGTDYTQRIGRSIQLDSIRLSGMLSGGQVNSVADDSFNTFRITIVTAITGSTTGYTVSSVLDERTVGGLQEILYDKTFSLMVPGRDSVGYLPALKMWNLVLPLHGMKIEYSNAMSNVQTNDVFIWMVSDSSGVPNPGFVNGSAVLVFEDY